MDLSFEGALLASLGLCVMVASVAAFALNLAFGGGASPWLFAIFFVGGALGCGAGLLLSRISE
jgi:hypothetical protein